MIQTPDARIDLFVSSPQSKFAHLRNDYVAQANVAMQRVNRCYAAASLHARQHRALHPLVVERRVCRRAFEIIHHYYLVLPWGCSQEVATVRGIASACVRQVILHVLIDLIVLRVVPVKSQAWKQLEQSHAHEQVPNPTRYSMFLRNLNQTGARSTHIHPSIPDAKSSEPILQQHWLRQANRRSARKLMAGAYPARISIENSSMVCGAVWKS